MHKEKIISIIESLLYVWGDPLDISDLSKITDIDKKTLNHILSEMIEVYNSSEDRGIMIKKYNNKYQFATKKDNFDYIQNLFQTNTRKTLSTAALETLSIIAYKQPVTRIEIEAIRGIKCSYIIKNLVEKGLVVETGKLNRPGKPSLYGTTDEFLRYFGLSSIKELPNVKIENLKEDGEKAT